VLTGALTAFLLLAWHGLSAADTVTETLAGRSAILYLPAKLPAPGSRSLVVVLHGGMGNAERIAQRRSESGLNMNGVAEEGGFVVAYLNGTRVARALGPNMLGWNAGGCCGLPAESGVDDVAYLQQAVGEIATRYGIDHKRVFGIGHSNGAMMTQRVHCETGLFAAAVAVSGGLETGATQCPAGQGKRIMAIHGALDRNVPLEGGQGKGLARVAFRSQAAAAQVWQRSGVPYELQVIAAADHAVGNIDAQIQKTESQTLAQKMAHFFGLLGS
jgi:polyhydroxybutyrate depolymerase